jgi:hypothetical protein
MYFVECNPDKALLCTLGISKKQVIHSYGKGNVCNRLKKTSNAIGLVDEDPKSAQPSYIKTLELIDTKDEIKLYFDSKTDNRLILLCPRLEDWIVLAARSANKDITKYGLPDNANVLHKVINIKQRNYQQLIEDIRDKSPMFKTLVGFLTIPNV